LEIECNLLPALSTQAKLPGIAFGYLSRQMNDGQESTIRLPCCQPQTAETPDSESI